MNSRPLIPLDTHSDDAVAPLTPGHFLVGGPLAALPSLPDTTANINALSRWNLVQRLSHDLWVRWRSEYLLLLQRRNKWRRPNREFKVGDVVLMKDIKQFQRVWPMGRISKVYPGRDVHVRAVDVMSDGKRFQRTIHKLVHLLWEEDHDGYSQRGEDVRVCERLRPDSDGIAGKRLSTQGSDVDDHCLSPSSSRRSHD